MKTLLIDLYVVAMVFGPLLMIGATLFKITGSRWKECSIVFCVGLAVTAWAVV